MGRAPEVTEGAARSPADMSRKRVRIGQREIDAVTFAEALERIADLVHGRAGGAGFTPNVDHIVKAEGHADFRSAYSQTLALKPRM